MILTSAALSVRIFTQFEYQGENIMFTRIVIISALILSAPLLNASSGKENSKAVETDTRLHPNGKGWRFDQAKITDSSRPRVLLVGDSILNGYINLSIKSLAGIAYVDAWVTPGHQSTRRGGCRDRRGWLRRRSM